jgi:hypothetical protein
MFRRKTRRKKDGKTHDYWSVVENKRVAGGRVVQVPPAFAPSRNSGDWLLLP